MEAPYAEEKKPATVTPICTAERNWLGSRTSVAVRSPRGPSSSSCLICDSRRLTIAISVPANTPPMSTKSSTRATFSRTEGSMGQNYR